MRKGKEDLRIVYVALVGIATFMAGYLYRSSQDSPAQLGRQPAAERCGHTYFESDFASDGFDTRLLYILPAASAGKSGEYL